MRGEEVDKEVRRTKIEGEVMCFYACKIIASVTEALKTQKSLQNCFILPTIITTEVNNEHLVK